MRFTLQLTFALFFMQSEIIAQSNQLNSIADLLFPNVKSKLTVAEKNKIASLSGFVLSGNKAQPFAQDKESKEYPFAAVVYPVDLNKDGTEEIFIIYGNSFTSGNTGSSVVVYIKNSTGNYTPHLGFPGMEPDILTSLNMGYPDLLIGGPGFEFPVFRWNGKTYDNFRTIKDKDMEKLKKTSVADLSKSYQREIK